MQQSARGGLLTVAKVFGALLLLLILLYAAYLVYASQRYGQHLPFTKLNVDGVEREYALFTPSSNSATPTTLGHITERWLCWTLALSPAATVATVGQRGWLRARHTFRPAASA